MTPPAPAQTWLHCTVARPEAGQRLFCFPHAGGSASFYREWGEHLTDTEVYAVQYPGRAERIIEEPPTDLRELGWVIGSVLLTLADRPIVLFGHSLGAAVALEAARCLEAHGVAVAHLVASGSRDAPLPPPEEDAGVDNDSEETVRRLIELGGTDPGLAADPYFQELVLPYIRSDGRMFHEYDNAETPTLHCPVTTIVGDVDADADSRPWHRLTTGAVVEQMVVGDHFYLIARPPFALLRTCFETVPSR